MWRVVANGIGSIKSKVQSEGVQMTICQKKFKTECEILNIIKGDQSFHKNYLMIYRILKIFDFCISHHFLLHRNPSTSYSTSSIYYYYFILFEIFDGVHTWTT